jgi:hypothetical protein
MRAHNGIASRNDPVIEFLRLQRSQANLARILDPLLAVSDENREKERADLVHEVRLEGDGRYLSASDADDPPLGSAQ